MQEGQEEVEEKTYSSSDEEEQNNTTRAPRPALQKDQSAQHFANAASSPAAPQARRGRPGLGQRISTTRGGTRTGTSSWMNSARTESYKYNFDGASSDSGLESSSSSEDEEDDDDDVEQNQHGAKSRNPSYAGKEKMQHSKSRDERRRFFIGNDFFKTHGRVSRKDGRLKISINEALNSGYVAKALGQGISNHLNVPHRDRHHHKADSTSKKMSQSGPADPDAEAIAASLRTATPKPRLNVVIMVIGSRGDIQPFLKVGKILAEKYGHRVRIASHPVFRDFVEKDVGLEFYSVGGDPSELMAFMVKNPGLVPSLSTVREGEVQKRRAAMAEMFEGFWHASINAPGREKDPENLRVIHDNDPFVADAIIANPPSMAHVHIAEKLGVPLHMMFTFPYTPTTLFPHPLANIKPKDSNVDANYVNFMSYPLVELMTWSGLGDIVNKFRENTLRLEPVSSLWAPGALYRMKVPYTYLWSPSLVPKPGDWGPEIDLSGFVFLDLAQNFEPPKELTDFLDAGEPPVYIGFGSIVLDEPDKFTEMIFEATKKAGVRALVNKGWGGFGGDNSSTPDHIFMLGNTPHDWLFPKVKAVVHHGGAGTTAIGLKCGKPTMIVPFFGDQPFWGAMVAEAKAGAHDCIPYRKLDADKFAKGIKQCLEPEAQENVRKIADSIEKEGDGAANAAESFQRTLPLAGRNSMRCSILQERVAVWKVKQSSLRLCALAAEILHKKGKFKWAELRLCRHYAWNDFDGPGEPITGTVGAISDSLYGIGEGMGMVPVRMAKHIRQREAHERRKRDKRKRKKEREKQNAAASEGVLEQPETNAVVYAEPENEEKIEEDTGPGELAVEARKPQAGGDRDSSNTKDPRPPAAPRLDTTTSTISADPLISFPAEMIDDLDTGLKRAALAALTLPNDLWFALAQGLHNAPRLWGDATVRKPTKITGVKSGLSAARREFAYGIYDGWTGLVKQPKGDWDDGEGLVEKFAGLGTGLGKGLGGFVLKNTNAAVAPLAFISQGVVKTLERRADTHDAKPFLRHARITQGERHFAALSTDSLAETTEKVLRGWAVYVDLWSTAHRDFGLGAGGVGGVAPEGGGGKTLLGRYRLSKEKKKWDVNGALESVETAGQALRVHKAGRDVGVVFEGGRQEVEGVEVGRESSLGEGVQGRGVAGQAAKEEVQGT